MYRPAEVWRSVGDLNYRNGIGCWNSPTSPALERLQRDGLRITSILLSRQIDLALLWESVNVTREVFDYASRW